MAQNEMRGEDAETSASRIWRLDLNQPSLPQMAAMVLLAFVIGAMLGLIFS